MTGQRTIKFATKAVGLLLLLTLALGGRSTLLEATAPPQIGLSNVLGVGSGEAESLSISPDGAWIAIAFTEAAWIFDVNARKVVSLVPAMLGTPGGISFSPDGRFLATYTREATDTYTHWIDIYAIEKGFDSCQRVSASLSRDFHLLTYSHDSSMLIGLRNDELVFWNVELGQVVKEVEIGKPNRHTSAVSKDRRLLALAYGSVIHLIDLRDGNPLGVLRGHTGEIVSLAISPNGALLASASTDNSIRIWDVNSKRSLMSIPLAISEVYKTALTFSPSGTFVAIGITTTATTTAHGYVAVYSTEGVLTRLIDALGPVLAVAPGPAPQAIWVATHAGLGIIDWSTPSTTNPRPPFTDISYALYAATYPVLQLSFTNRGDLFYSTGAGDDLNMRFQPHEDLMDQGVAYGYCGYALGYQERIRNSVAISRSGQYLVYQLHHGQGTGYDIILRDCESPCACPQLADPNFISELERLRQTDSLLSETQGRMTAAAFSPDNTLLAISTNEYREDEGHVNVISVYNVADRGLLFRWDTEADSSSNAIVAALAISPDNAYLVTGAVRSTSAKCVEIWEIASAETTHKPVETLECVHGCSFCEPTWDIWKAAFSATGRFLVIGYRFSEDMEASYYISVWDMLTDREVMRFGTPNETYHPGDRYFDGVFTPDEKLFITCSAKGGSSELAFRLWEVGSWEEKHALLLPMPRYVISSFYEDFLPVLAMDPIGSTVACGFEKCILLLEFTQ